MPTHLCCIEMGSAEYNVCLCQPLRSPEGVGGQCHEAGLYWKGALMLDPTETQHFEEAYREYESRNCHSKRHKAGKNQQNP